MAAAGIALGMALTGCTHSSPAATSNPANPATPPVLTASTRSAAPTWAPTGPSPTAVKVAITSLGTGPHVVVLISGGPGLAEPDLLGAFSHLVARGFRVVSYEARGVGRSPVPMDSDYSPRAYVADLEALRVRLGVARFDLIGHSWGGEIAALYTAAYPQHVGAVVEIAGVPLSAAASQEGSDRFQVRLDGLQRRGVLPALLPGPNGDDCWPAVAAVLAVYAPDPRHPGAYLRQTRFPCSERVLEMTDAAFAEDDAQVQHLATSLSRWSGRALIAMGAEDPFGTGWATADAQQYPAARVTELVVPHAGHVIWLDDPTFTGRVATFLAADR